mgnify:FL=1|tara:strand:+ start:404 stop:592 length:189 start_codon:yes stop_codon:yes gene_type:complete
MIDLLEYIGLALIIFGGCLYFLAVYMIKKYEKKLLENKLHKSFMKEKQNEKNNFNYKHTIIK